MKKKHGVCLFTEKSFSKKYSKWLGAKCLFSQKKKG